MLRTLFCSRISRGRLLKSPIHVAERRKPAQAARFCMEGALKPDGLRRAATNAIDSGSQSGENSGGLL